MKMLDEDKWQEELDSLVMPYITKRMTDMSENGIRMEKYSSDEPKATLAIVHGFSEGIYKYCEMIYYMLREGYDCWILELPGHGRSYATIESNDRVHTTNFNEYIDALEEMMKKISSPLPIYLFGHSMGGCVALRYVEERNCIAEKAVLSSPMFKVNTDPVPEHIAQRIAVVLTKLGHGEEYVPGQGPFDPEKKNFDSAGTTSYPRFLYNHDTRVSHPEHQKVSSSLNAMVEGMKASKIVRRNLDKVKIPVLLFEAEKDTYVDVKGFEKVKPGMPIKVVKTKHTHHEVLNSPPEVAGPLYDMMLEFLGN